MYLTTRQKKRVLNEFIVLQRLVVQFVSLYDKPRNVLEGEVNSIFHFSEGFAKVWITKSMTIEFMCDDDNKIKTILNY